jgi:hypothetical protein
MYGSRNNFKNNTMVINASRDAQKAKSKVDIRNLNLNVESVVAVSFAGVRN